MNIATYFITEYFAYSALLGMHLLSVMLIPTGMTCEFTFANHSS